MKNIELFDLCVAEIMKFPVSLECTTPFGEEITTAVKSDIIDLAVSNATACNHARRNFIG